MAKKPETKFRENTYKELDTLPNTWYESIQQTSIRGTPDVIMCINGLFIALEYKKDGSTQPEKLQMYKHIKISQAHGIVFVVYPGNWLKIFRKLQKIAHGKPYYP